MGFYTINKNVSHKMYDMCNTFIPIFISFYFIMTLSRQGSTPVWIRSILTKLCWSTVCLFPHCAEPHISRTILANTRQNKVHTWLVTRRRRKSCVWLCAHPHPVFQVSATLPLWDHNFDLLGRFTHFAKRRFPPQRSQAHLQRNLPS